MSLEGTACFPVSCKWTSQTQPASLLGWGNKGASRGVKRKMMKGEEENDEEEEEGKEEGEARSPWNQTINHNQ